MVGCGTRIIHNEINYKVSWQLRKKFQNYEFLEKLEKIG
jgi:hypothetical protein